MRIPGALAVGFLVALRAGADGPARTTGTTALVGVDVVPMDEPRLLRDQTVVVAGGRIVAMGPARAVDVPAAAQVIPGHGRFLMPGLYDLYTHVHEAALDLYLANGVTTVRNTAPGLASHLALRDAVASGVLLGPRIVTTGPVLDGLAPSYSSVGPVATAAEARAAVEQQARMGYDGVMVYVGIEPIPYAAVLESAARLGLPVGGHLPFKLPPDWPYRLGQRSKENLVGEVNLETGGTFVPGDQLAAVARRAAASGIWTIPTLTIHKARAWTGGTESLLARPEMRFVPPRQLAHWRGSARRAFAAESYRYTGAPELVRRLHEAGARLLLGSDAGYPTIVHGFSIHDELANLVEAGLSPFAALRAGTRDAAEYLGELDHAGTVAVGKRADLLLLAAHPLDDVRHVARPVGVMVAGRWLPERELRERIERQVAAFRAERDRFDGLPALAGCPGPGCGRYEVRLRGVVAGEQRLSFPPARAGRRALTAQVVVDPHLATRTEMQVVLDGAGRAIALDVRRRMAGAEARVHIRRVPGGRALVRAELPRLPAEEWEEDLAEDALLGGPELAVNLDIDVLANIQLLLVQAAGLGPGQGQLIRMKRAELNEEEHGRRGVTGDPAYWVAREPPGAAGSAAAFQIYVPGLNGAGVGLVRARLAPDGLVESVSAADGALVVERVAWR